MGLLDQLAGQVLGALAGGQQQGDAAAEGFGGQAPLLQAVIGLIQNTPGGLEGLLARLTQGGLGEQVASWVGTGQNLPASADQLSAALGADAIGQVAGGLGLPQEQVGDSLAALLPQVIDRLTPAGQLPETNDLMAQGLNMLTSVLAGKE